MNRQEWAAALLTYAGLEQSAEKIDALVAQASKENAGSVWNPLATTEPAPGATNYNAVGVKNYPTLDEGLGATWATFTNGHYPTLLAILRDPAGGSAGTYCASPELNVWGTGDCTAELTAIRSGDPFGYLTHPIAGTVEPVPPPAPVPVPVPSPAPPAPVPGGTCMIELPVLQQGVNGWTTKALQLTLRGWVPALGVDGIFGPATRDAVVEVQHLGGVAQDGVVGPVTWNLVLKGTVN